MINGYQVQNIIGFQDIQNWKSIMKIIVKYV